MRYAYYQRVDHNRYPHWFERDPDVVTIQEFHREVYPWLKGNLGPHLVHGGRYRADHQIVRIVSDDDAFAFRMRWC